MATDNQLKRLLLRLLIISLSASALVGIIIFLLGSFGEIEEKILITTVAIGASSLLGLCCATVYPNTRLRPLGTAGVALSAIVLVYTIVMIWGNITGNITLKAYFSILIWTVTVAHISLLLLVSPVNALVRKVLTTTIMCIVVVSAMLTLFLIHEKIGTNFYFRLLGVFAILDALGTIVTPILNKAQRTSV